MDYAITAFYKFTLLPQEKLETTRNELSAYGRKNAMGGLTIIGTEGINGTVAGSSEAIADWKKLIAQLVGEISFKDTDAYEQPFRRWFVKIREEIVSLGDATAVPSGNERHISAEEWDRMIDEEDVVIVDARNTYETEIGKFDGAVDPGLKNFQDFPAWVSRCGIPKEKKILMYCTGGIRCEKAYIAMERRGYSNIFQLEGGILGYLAAKPEGKWRGECFVFDHRVAVGKDLRPSMRYRLCPHCGDPGDRKIRCEYCSCDGTVCARCLESPNGRSCGKNCAHHLIRGAEKTAAAR